MDFTVAAKITRSASYINLFYFSLNDTKAMWLLAMGIKCDEFHRRLNLFVSLIQVKGLCPLMLSSFNGLVWWYTPADTQLSLLCMITSGYDMALFKGIKNLPRKHSVEKMNLPKRRTRSDGKFREWCLKLVWLISWFVDLFVLVIPCVVVADADSVNWQLSTATPWIDDIIKWKDCTSPSFNQIRDLCMSPIRFLAANVCFFIFSCLCASFCLVPRVDI